jgi:hypothetical protein
LDHPIFDDRKQLKPQIVVCQEMLARLLWRLRHDRSGVNRLKFAWKILRLRQVSLSEERILENFRTFSVGRPVGYP